jgi:hypothetical protein
MKIAYIFAVLILELVLLALAVFAPIYITPGYYWWTVFAIIVLTSSGASATRQLDSWDGDD